MLEKGKLAKEKGASLLEELWKQVVSCLMRCLSLWSFKEIEEATPERETRCNPKRGQKRITGVNRVAEYDMGQVFTAQMVFDLNDSTERS